MNKINTLPRMRMPSAEPMHTPAIAPLLSPLGDEDEDGDGDGDEGGDDEEDDDICDVIITVEEVGDVGVVIAGLVDVGTAEAEVVTGMEKPALA